MTSSNPNSPTNSPLNFRPFALTKGRKFKFLPANSVGLAKPVITQALQTGGDAIQVTWGESGGTSYALQVSTDGGTTFSDVTTAASTSFTHTGLSFPGSYTYRVRSLLDAEVSDWSDNVTETMVDVPAAPGGLTVTGATTSSISLSWNDTADEGSYLVESSVDGLGSWTSAGSTNQNVTTFTHTGLSESVQRYYRVTAVNKAGGSIPSSTANSWTVPAAPTGLTATASGSTQVDLSWTDVSTGNQSYKVERSTDNSTWTEIATGLSATATTYSATGLSGSTLYYFRVRAANAAQNSAYSGTASATTSVAAPSSLTATATSSTQINLAWTDNSSTETGFKVERSTDNTNWTEIAGAVAANSTTYSATGLTASTLYYFRVRAYNAGGNSAYTSSASATTQSGALSPSWTLDFSTGEPWANGTNYVFSSTASTSRTFVNSSGYVAPCVANLIQRSEDLANAAWTKTRVSITANDSTAPDGTTTADRIVEDTANNFRGADSSNTSSLAAGGNRCWSIYVKKPSTNGRSIVGIAVEDGGNGYFGKRFDLDAGTAVGANYNTNTTNITNLAFGIVNVGSGWYRCWVSARSANAGSCDGRVSPMLSSTSAFFAGLADTYQGDGVSGILAWGGQFEEASTPSPYSATTSSSNGIPRLTHNSSGSRLGLLVEGQRTNLQTQSTLASSVWAIDSATRVSTTETAPDNTSTATLLRDSSGTIYHMIINDGGQPAVSASTVYTFSCYLKAGSSNYGALSMWFGSVRYTAVFELTGSGAVTSTSSASSPTSPSSGIESVGNGWYRCRVTYTSPVGATNARLFLCISNSATPSYNANLPAWSFTNTTDVRMWGAQLEQAETVSSYIPTTTASVTRSADLAHVLDSSITSWGDPGALVVHFYPPGQAGTLISTDDASTAQVGIEANTVTDVRAFWSSGSTAAETMTAGVQKAVHYWTGSTSKLCLNGGAVRSGTNNFTIANADFVTLGAEATDSAGAPGTFSQYANCIIRKVEFYSGTLTDSQLQAVTT